MDAKSILIIGASRGIGLGLAREFGRRGWQVFASRRSSAPELEEAAAASNGQITVVTADVTDEASIEALGEQIGDGALDALVLNAGVYGPDDQSLAGLDRDSVADILTTNAIGPAKAALTLLPLLHEGARIGLMSSKMGSIDDSSGGANHYRISKVAQNMLARSVFEQHASERGISVLSLHPGWVQTEMGGPNAPVSVEQSVRGLADILEEERATPVHAFLAFDGSTVAW